MKELIANGADPLQKNDTGMTALQFAAQGNQPAIITYLIDYQNIGINETDNKKSSAVHWAIFNSNELALGFLLARKPYINNQDVQGLTPLHLAVSSAEGRGRSTILIRMLLMRGADPTICDNKGRLPL